jgi:hypothetical protein
MRARWAAATTASSFSLLGVASLLALATACDVDKIAEQLYGAPPEPEGASCDMTMDNLAGRDFVMLEALPDKTNRNNPQARGRFFEEEGKLKVKYTVKSIADVYTYECRKIRDGKEWECVEEPRLQDWCQALETYEKDLCTPAKLKEFGAEGISTDEEIAKAVTDAKEVVNRYRDAAEAPEADEVAKRNWEQFRLNNNNLGNKLQGLLYASVDTKRCQLSVTDMYMVIFDGKQKKDSNPVGTNAFVEDKTPYLWEHCDDGKFLLDMATAERPPAGEVPPKAPHELGTPVYYQYYGEKAAKAEEGCTYSYDSYAQWLPVAQDVAVAPNEEGEVVWSASHTFSDAAAVELVNPANPIGVFTMVRHQVCNGKKDKIDTVCNASRVMVP